MKTINATQLKHMIDGDETFEFINVLAEEDFSKEHIPGSINLPVQAPNFVSNVEQRVGGDQDHKIVVYCASTTCDASQKAARKLDDAGFTNVLDYEAGMEGWKKAGHPIESGAVRA